MSVEAPKSQNLVGQPVSRGQYHAGWSTRLLPAAVQVGAQITKRLLVADTDAHAWDFPIFVEATSESAQGVDIIYRWGDHYQTYGCLRLDSQGELWDDQWPAGYLPDAQTDLDRELQALTQQLEPLTEAGIQ